MSARAVSVWFIDTDDAPMAVRIGLINDVEDARKLASTLFGDSVLVPLVDTDLATAMANNDSHVYAGSYGSLAVVSTPLFATIRPASLTKTIMAMRPSAAATLLVTNPEESIGAFARWENGELRRSLSANPVDLYEDIGVPFVFEGPFWGGEHPLRYAPGVAPEPLALPFHPQQLAEQSNREWLGFRYTHPLAPTDYDPARIPVTGFAIHPAGYEPTEADLAEYRRRSTAPSGYGRPAPGPTVGPAVAPPGQAVEAAPRHEPHKRGRFARYFGFGVKKDAAAEQIPPSAGAPPVAPQAVPPQPVAQPPVVPPPVVPPPPAQSVAGDHAVVGESAVGEPVIEERATEERVVEEPTAVDPPETLATPESSAPEGGQGDRGAESGEQPDQ